tara:strand:+ start:5919 stop:6488 length:570 start_codon:yes stop_codon:yes gene_type:complete
MKYSIYAESTPNPSTMKFVANRMLIEQSIEITNKKDGEGINIAKKLFSFPFIKNIFISNNFISITKKENASWEEITMQLREFIVDFLNENGLIVSLNNNIKLEKNKEKEIFSKTEEKIINLINEYIKPAVESDGGLIDFHSYEDGIVRVILKGACSGCPSSQATLKQGVEQLLKSKIGNEIIEVIAENR